MRKMNKKFQNLLDCFLVFFFFLSIAPNQLHVSSSHLICECDKIFLFFVIKLIFISFINLFICSFPGLIVFVGVKFVNKFAAVALTCVICSIIAVYVGIFDNFNGNEKLQWVLTFLILFLFFIHSYIHSFKMQLILTNNNKRRKTCCWWWTIVK